MYDFSGKYAVVTGAAKGIGAAIAKRLFTDGVAGVALLDIDYDLVNGTAKELDTTGTRAIAVQCNVSDKDSVEAAFKKVYEVFGKVDILVNNAGITRDAMAHKMTYDQWSQVIKVDLDSVFLCTSQVINPMREQGYGKIVNIASTSAFGNVGQANYSAAKAGIHGLTRTLALELGRKNITVNAINPGFIATDIVKTVPDHILEISKASNPMGRLGKPEEIADLAAYLASDESSYVSGQLINCNGGVK